MSARPTGTVTFLFTDIEGSTRLAQQHGSAWSDAKARHHAILRTAIEAHGGYVFQVIGDAFCAAFATAPGALAAALDVQRALVGAIPAGALPIRVRMGIHTGAATALPNGDYEGYLTLARVQRVMSVAHGGQVLLSQSSVDLLADALRDGVALRDLGTHRLKDLPAPEHLYQLIAPDLPTDFPPLKTADHPNNLPPQLTSFIGRDAEITEVRRLLSGTRLLTLTGSGGVGKTRLALEVAARELHNYPDGAWFVELAPLADPALIANTIAAAIGVREEPSRPMLATLVDHFRTQTALIVLDNCEHLLADTARACDALLHAAPQLKIIATSRESLGIAGEQAYRVPSLSLPPEAFDPKGVPDLSGLATRYESVRLFVERARAVKSDFDLTRTNAPAVAQICRRLDGIPLAVELAAARVKALSPDQIAARLDERFRILTGGSRTALPRQQTLRAAIDWSYRLLSGSERALLRRLSVFAGGWTLEAAESVCGDQPLDGEPSTGSSEQAFIAPGSVPAAEVLDWLTRLVDKSLVAVEDTQATVRYRVLETVRQYAREMLDNSDEAERVRDRHVIYFAGWAEAVGDVRRDPATQLPVIRAELDNLRAAMTWALHHRTAEGLRLAGAIASRLRMLGNSKEAYHWLVSFLSHDTRDVSVSRVRALSAAGVLASNLPGEVEHGQAYAREGAALGRLVGDKAALALALTSEAIFLRDVNARQAQAGLDEALRLSLEMGEAALVSVVNNALGEFWRSQGDVARARACYEQSLAYTRSAWDHPSPVVLLNLAFIMLRQGDGARARTLSTEALTVIRNTGARFSTPYALACLGSAAVLRHQPALAVRLFGAAAAVLEQFALSFDEIERSAFDDQLAVARSQLDPAAFDAAFATGRALSYDEALAYALEGDDASH